MTMPKWASAALACPRCGGALSGLAAKQTTVTRCEDCGPYPVLAGVPVLVPEPARWCATFYDAALSALAEADLASRVAVQTLKAFADAAPGAEASRFSDDWTAWEAAGAAPPELHEGPGADALAELLKIAALQAPSLWLEHRTPDGVVLELGCGAGATSARLNTKRRSLMVGDVSLRAVLAASHRSGAVPVVMDAQALPLRARAFDAIVAENVVDLLEDAEGFFTSAKLALKPGGALLLASPAPSLGSPDEDDGVLARLASSAGFEVDESADGLPWLRRNSGRFVEVWLVQVLALRHSRAKRR
ncbi:MAG: methyltransferase domain-containing protein [Myxococcus sp.]|nr:methyltransferase domain-containing protein [Myxococcus sp.]